MYDSTGLHIQSCVGLQARHKGTRDVVGGHTVGMLQEEGYVRQQSVSFRISWWGKRLVGHCHSIMHEFPYNVLCSYYMFGVVGIQI